MGLLHIEQRKGKPDHLDGRLTVYAKVTVENAEMILSNNPIAGMIHNGFLVAQGNYKEQSSLKDFLKSELGQSFEEGLEELIEKLDGLESALDPQKLKDKLKNFDEFKDIIPTPAKIVIFHSEEEILAQAGDVFFVGSFNTVPNANLSVNSFPILYQACYREQEIELVRNEIDQLIYQVESTAPTLAEKKHWAKSVEERIIKEFIPGLLYAKKDQKNYELKAQQFRDFLPEYRYPSDIEKIISIIARYESTSTFYSQLLELYAKKIEYVCNEEFTLVEEVAQKIREIEQQLSI